MKIMEFINAHREDEDYCECLIHPDGEVDEPLPSHIGRLIEIAGEDSATLNGQMEKNMEPLFWMVEYTGCMSVWQTRVVAPTQPTQVQEDVLEMLYDAAFLSPKYLYENRTPPMWRVSVRQGRQLRRKEGRRKNEQPSGRVIPSAVLVNFIIIGKQRIRYEACRHKNNQNRTSRSAFLQNRGCTAHV